MQNQPGSRVGVEKITQQDWNSLFEGLQENSQTRRVESIQSTVSYFAKENKLNALQSYCEEILQQIQQHQGTTGGTPSGR